MSNNRPIGVFDSGVGGLTVVKELIRQLPNEDIVYFGDTARVPYGTKSRQTIIRFSIENILFLLKHDVKLIVVACNSSSSAALSILKRNFKVPIVGVIEPGAADAADTSVNKKISVIGTSATVRSQAYAKHIKRLMPSAVVFSQSCPLFVPLVEEGWLDGKVTQQVIGHYLLPMKGKGVDTMILGCTHYPLLKSQIKRFMGQKVTLVDSAVSTARSVKVLVSELGLANNKKTRGKLKVFVSDEPDHFTKIGEKFLGRHLDRVRKVSNGV